MPRHKWESVSPDYVLEKLRKAGISEHNKIEKEKSIVDIEKLEKRVSELLNIANNPNRKKNDMIFFVMYDIESDKVRTLVSKYLIAQGCIRVQNSIFIADSTQERMKSIKNDLKSVQATYENNDSILVVPVSSENITSMHIIGKEIDLDFVTKGKSTVFF